MTDNERLEKRLAILSKVNSILKRCHCESENFKTSCEHCEKLMPLGEQLLKLTKPRKQISTSGEITMDVERKVKERPQRLKSRQFTVEEYALAKISGVSDDEFRARCNVSKNMLVKWKKAHKSEIFIALNNLQIRENKRVKVRGMLKG